MDTITATYVQHEDEWTVTVAGFDQELHAKAPGIIAARDHAEQLVDQLAPAEIRPTVVHLLDGSALQFTAAYMSARLVRTDIGRMVDIDEEHTGGQSTADAQDQTGEQDAGSRSGMNNQESAASAEQPDTAENTGEKASQPQVPTQARTVLRKELSKTPDTLAGEHTRGKADASSPARADAQYASTAASGAAGGTDKQA